MTDLSSLSGSAPSAVPRRAFLRVAGASAATVSLVLAGCGTDTPTPEATPTVLSFGSGADTDVRVLNYLFFIKQLEFDFYNRVVAAFPADFTAAEQGYFRDLRDHELVHRQVLGDVLGTNALAALLFDFASVTLTTRAGVLEAARRLEDTGSGAFLGVLPRLNSAPLFTLTAQMASAEARHAALLRDVQTLGSFAGAEVVTDGLAIARTPAQVAEVLAPFLPTLTIDVSSLPTA